MALRADERISADAAQALDRATAYLLSLQHADDYWKGELETNVTMDAEDLLLREFLGIRRQDETELAAAWIRSQQRDDGTWATFHAGPGDLSTTVEAYTALRLAGDPADAAHMRRAAAFVRDGGGLESSRVFTRLWLALFGEWPWDALPALPPEVMFLPSWFPLNIYDFACWARQTIVPLTIVWSYRPRAHLPFTLDELRTGRRPVLDAPRPSWRAAFLGLDRVLHAYERRRLSWLRRRALERAERWIVQRQEADGSWGGIQPPWVYSLIALRLRGYALDHPVMREGLRGLDRFTITDDRGRRLEACQSPVWDTALAVIALSDAGLASEHPALVRAASWLRGEEIRVRGDWAVRRPALEPGGWAFEFCNDNYPDIDDTAEVVMALRRVGVDAEDAIARAVAWTIGMASRDGAWAAFDADNTRRICTELPFCDFGEVIDPPSEDVTAHVVEMLCAERGTDDAAVRRAVARLSRWQRSDGSWFGRWGANHLYGTGAAVPALVAAGVAQTDRRIRKAVAFLERHQNADGGWGEDMRSYVDPNWIGRGASTASQTAWALIALLAAGEQHSGAASRGVEFLCQTQLANGGWDEPRFTGTGFPGDFYINYHLYRLVFPVSALGRYVNGTHRR